MSKFTKIKIPLLLVFGLAAAAAAILIGAGFVGGSSSASDRSAAKAGAWRRVAQAPEPIASGRTTVWTGTEMIVAGVNPGSDGTFIHSTEVAEAYDPAADTWRELADPPATPGYCRRDAVWTGKQMLVWGCDLLSYDPAANEWRRLPDPPTRHGILAWTGHELLGWGGGCCGDVSDDGSAYNPATNTWRKLAPAPVSGQQSPIGAWTGRELVIFNGHGPEGNRVGGAAYNPKLGYLAADRVTVGDPSLDRRLRRERDLRARRAPRPGVQPLQRQLAATAAECGRRRRSRHGLDGQSPDRVRHGHQGLRPAKRSLDDALAVAAGLSAGRRCGVDGPRDDRLGRRGSGGFGLAEIPRGWSCVSPGEVFAATAAVLLLRLEKHG